MRSLGIGQDFFLSLPLKQKTVRIHVLIHLGTVVGSMVVIEQRVANDCFLIRYEFEGLADLGELLLVRTVPGALFEQILGVLIGG